MLRIPPAWTNVVINPDLNAKCRVTGIDKVGRVQRLYSQEHTDNAKAEKFERVKELLQEWDNIKYQIENDLNSTGLRQENALVAYLIYNTGIRPGSNAETLAKVKAYGATTLQLRHITICERGVRLKFIGKKGVAQNILVTNPYLVWVLTNRKNATSAYTTTVFGCSSSSLRIYFNELGSGQYTPKDFRTALGTSLALKLLGNRVRLPIAMSKRKKLVNAALDKVAKLLGNTRAVSRSSYVDPVILERFFVS